MAHAKVIVVPSTQTLDKMFELQEELMKHYQQLEVFPDWPWDLNIKENQKRLKGFAERFIDELSEAFEQIVNMINLASSNKKVEAKQSNKFFNAEIGDATCFILETLLLAGIGPEELRNWMDAYKKENPHYGSMLDEEKLLGSFSKFGFFRNQEEGFTIDSINMFEVLPMQDILKHENHEWLGCRRVSESFGNQISIFLWYIDHTLRQAFRNLKIKEWSQAEKVANVFGFQHSLIDTFILFIQLLQYIEKNEQSIYNTYYLTYLKNMERIKGGY